MKRVMPLVGFLILATAVALAPLATQAASNDRWLHVRIEKSGEKGESVRVNVPLAVAEKVLPAIRSDELRDGKLKIHHARVNGVDVRALLEAIRSLNDGEFVTIDSDHQSVRVAKQGGYLIAKVDDHEGKQERVDVKIPFRVVEALLSGAEDELDLLAAVEALNASADEVLVSVESEDETVRVWIDSKSETE